MTGALILWVYNLTLINPTSLQLNMETLNSANFFFYFVLVIIILILSCILLTPFIYGQEYFNFSHSRVLRRIYPGMARSRYDNSPEMVLTTTRSN